LQWRTKLGRFHAEQSAEILRALGYDEQTIEKVRHINAKVGLRSDPDVQTMEDALCLSFLEHELAGFAERHADDKIVEILQKTWKKMSQADTQRRSGAVRVFRRERERSSSKRSRVERSGPAA
jgi:hypothetical protein